MFLTSVPEAINLSHLIGSNTGSQPLTLPPQSERTDPPPAVAVRPYVPDHPSRPQSPRKGPATMNSSSIYSMYLQQPQAKNYGSLSNRTTVKAGKVNSNKRQIQILWSFESFPFCPTVYGKPILPTSSTSPSPLPFLHGGTRTEDVTDKEGGRGVGGGEPMDGSNLPPPSVDNIPRPLSPTKLTPVGKLHTIKSVMSRYLQTLRSFITWSQNHIFL